MRVIFTVCSYNHIARAFSLAASVAEFCHDTRCVICLIGDASHIPANNPGNGEILLAEEMGLPFLKEMAAKYTPLELNSALKPYFALHLLSKFGVKEIIYLDSDILLFSELGEIYELLQEYSIILTPHATSTAPEGSAIDDRNLLRTGIYNAGFFAVNNDSYGLSFLTWWKDKLRHQSFINARKGMFAEQLWLNLVPLFFERTLVLKNAGYNVAYWNLHERKISRADSIPMVNGERLVFFHFSGASFDCFEKNTLSDHQDKFTFSNTPEVIPLFKKYVQQLLLFKHPAYHDYETIVFGLKTKSALLKALNSKIKKIIKKIHET